MYGCTFTISHCSDLRPRPVKRSLADPSNSLIALDEVYDNAEAGLRKIEDLNEAFAAYDSLNSTVVEKFL